MPGEQRGSAPSIESNSLWSVTSNLLRLTLAVLDAPLPCLCEAPRGFIPNQCPGENDGKK